MSIFIKVIRELATHIGITLCSRCLAWTKIIRTDDLGDDTWVGYAICPKCGQKDNWMEGGPGSGGIIAGP